MASHNSFATYDGEVEIQTVKDFIFDSRGKGALARCASANAKYKHGGAVRMPLEMSPRKRGRPRKGEWQEDPRLASPVKVYFVDPETLK